MTKAKFEELYSKAIRDYDKSRSKLWNLIYSISSGESSMVSDEERRSLHGVQEAIRAQMERLDDLLMRPYGKLSMSELKRKVRGW